MRRALPLLVLACALLAAVPSPAAAARRGDLLQDLAPTSTAFTDAVLPSAPPRATAAQVTKSYPLPEGGSIAVTVSPAYTNPDPLAESYVAFLASLLHGPELQRLHVVIGTPAEVQRACGGEDVLACYTTDGYTMLVPGEQIDGGSGVTTSYVVAHEYGHHVAAFRSNAPFRAIDWGPKRWASQRLVCRGVNRGKLAPGDEAERYGENPGEAWAETYAQLKYPGVPWQYTPLLRPTPGALAAAQQDVLAPWTAPVTKRWTGRLGGTVRKRSFSFRLRLDGSARFRLDGPARAEYDLRIVDDGQLITTTKGPGADDRRSFEAACRDRQAETVTLTVLRRSGRGPFTLTARYAG